MNTRRALTLSAALTGFAANSLLTRAAVGSGALDAGTFALIRIVSGAAILGVLASRRPNVRSGRAPRIRWLAAVSLAGYLAAFTLAYTRIGAAVGALLLFGAVQVTMVTAGLARGERPTPLGWIGAALAVGGLLLLTLPGVSSPDVLGSTLMAAAGACWGVYSLLGRGSTAPLADTASNFARASLLSIPALGWLAWPPAGVTAGVVMAIVSGTLASGVAYTFWYAALPALSAWRAAILQLMVPVLAAAGAWLLLDEPVTARLAAAGALVALGVWCTSAPHRSDAH